MNEPRTPSEPRDEHDPVADFFAAERDDIRPLPADDVRWQRITREARQARRTGWWRYAVAAAAVVVVGGSVWGVARHDGTTEAGSRPAVTQTVYVEATPTAAPSTEQRTSQTAPVAPATTVATAPTTPDGTAVPSDFRVVSVSTVASGRLFALGSVSCAGTSCAAVATSADRGATWSLRGRVPGHAVAPRVDAAGATLGTSGTVTDVRFADDATGWVFGSAVLRTTDGGRTWSDYGHAGGPAVVDLETDGRTVYLATAASCASGTCGGDLSLVSAAVGATRADTVVGVRDVGQGLQRADIWLGGSAPVVGVVGSQPVDLLRVGDGGSGLLGSPDTCPTTGSTRLVGPASGSGLVLLCAPEGAAGSLHLPLVTSPDLGATWSTVPGSGATVVDAGAVTAAASDASHLLVASGGSSDVHGSLSVSADGGRTWHEPASPPPLPGRGWAWVASPGAGTYYAVPVDATGSFWRSTDRGEHWSEVRVAG